MTYKIIDINAHKYRHIFFPPEEKEAEENKELTDSCKERESDVGKKSNVPPIPGEPEDLSWSREVSTLLPKDE